VPPGRFVTDASLAWLARRLRALGYDVRVLEGATLSEVCAVARAESLIVLTLSARVPAPCAFVGLVLAHRSDPSRTVREIASAYAPPSPPFERCLRCNAELERTAAMPPERAQAPPEPRRVRRCPGCGHWYWRGSHLDRLREWLEAALGRPVDAGDG
jgi:uncharacterized protein with PIN domain